MSEEPRRIEISWVQAVASALAAVSTAVLLSTVGVAGTIIGAAIGSVAATVGSAVYSHYLAASRDRVTAAAAARARVRRGQADPGEAAAGLAAGTHAEERSPWREALRGLSWRRVVLAAAALFVVAMAAIVTFELIAGRAVSSYTGGSDRNGPRVSVPGVGGGETEKPEPTPTPTPTPSALPSSASATPTTAPPSPSASLSGTATASEAPSSTAPSPSPTEPGPTSPATG